MITELINLKQIDPEKYKIINYFQEKKIITLPQNIEQINSGFSRPLKLNFAQGNSLVLKHLRDNNPTSQKTKNIVTQLFGKIQNKKLESVFVKVLHQERIEDKYWQLLEYEKGFETPVLVNRLLSLKEIDAFVELILKIHNEISKIHSLKEEVDYMYIFRVRLDKRIQSALRQNANEKEYLMDQADHLIKDFKKLNFPEGFNINFFHGDIHKENILWMDFNNNFEVEKIIDYEFTSCPLGLDLIMPIINIINNVDWNYTVPDVNLLLSKEFIYFLKRYLEKGNISSNEVKAIPIFFKYQLLIFYTLKINDRNYLSKLMNEIEVLNSMEFKQKYMSVINDITNL